MISGMRRTTRALALAAALSFSAVALAGCSAGSLHLEKPSPSKTWWSADAGDAATISVKDAVSEAGLSRVLVCTSAEPKIVFTDVSGFEALDNDRPGVVVEGDTIRTGEGDFRFRPAGSSGGWIEFSVGESYCP